MPSGSRVSAPTPTSRPSSRMPSQHSTPGVPRPGEGVRVGDVEQVVDLAGVPDLLDGSCGRLAGLPGQHPVPVAVPRVLPGVGHPVVRRVLDGEPGRRSCAASDRISGTRSSGGPRQVRTGPVATSPGRPRVPCTTTARPETQARRWSPGRPGAARTGGRLAAAAPRAPPRARRSRATFSAAPCGRHATPGPAQWQGERTPGPRHRDLLRRDRRRHRPRAHPARRRGRLQRRGARPLRRRRARGRQPGPPRGDGADHRAGLRRRRRRARTTSTRSRSPAGPGLAGALLVGVAAAKALAVGLGKPLYGVNHLAAHVAVDQLEHGPLPEPCLALLVSRRALRRCCGSTT